MIFLSAMNTFDRITDSVISTTCDKHHKFSHNRFLDSPQPVRIRIRTVNHQWCNIFVRTELDW